MSTYTKSFPGTSETRLSHKKINPSPNRGVRKILFLKKIDLSPNRPTGTSIKRLSHKKIDPSSNRGVLGRQKKTPPPKDRSLSQQGRAECLYWLTI